MAEAHVSSHQHPRLIGTVTVFGLGEPGVTPEAIKGQLEYEIEALIGECEKQITEYYADG